MIPFITMTLEIASVIIKEIIKIMMIQVNITISIATQNVVNQFTPPSLLRDGWNHNKIRENAIQAPIIVRMKYVIRNSTSYPCIYTNTKISQVN